MESLASDVLWVVYVGFALSFLLSFGVGANDVANSFVTSIGSGVLTLRQAKIIASICEASGAILLGYKVSETMRKGILEVSVYKHSEKELMFGCLAALASSCIWMLVVTCFKLPVSATHSLVGAIIGFSIFDRGTKGINWFIAGEIALSWAIAPVLSGICSLLLYLALYKLVVTTKHPLKAGFISLPIFCGLTFFVNVISILVLNTGSPIIQEIPSWIGWLYR